MEICIRCNISSDEVRLFDAIYDGRMAVICERCSIIENIPIIKKPDSEKLKESESTTIGVYDRMKVMAGMKEFEKDETFFQEDKLNELNKNPELELPEKEQLKLIDHYQWEIMKNRRRKGLTQKQLGETLGESEAAIQMIEKGKLPENAERIINKLEQFFQIKLKEISERERIIKARGELNEPILLDDKGNVLDMIPEEKQEIECKIEQFDDEKRKMVCKTSSDIETPKQYIDKTKDLDLRRLDAQRVTISDLKEIHKKRVEASRREQIEEQKKIEERQRILQALRERDKLKQEKEREDNLLKKQKAEQEKQRLIDKRKQEFEMQRKKEFDNIDKFLGGSEVLNREVSDNIESRRNVDEFDK